MKKNKIFLIIFFLSIQVVTAQLNWNKVNPSTADYFSDIHAFDANKAIAVGSLGAIWGTTDGGATWNPRLSPISDDLNGIFFYNASIGWIVAGTKVLKSLDGGVTWNIIYSGFPKSMSSIYFVDANTGWVCGQNGYIFKTLDGGANWTEQTNVGNHLIFGWLMSIYFINDQKGFAVGSNNSYASTTDGGATWTLSESSNGNGLWGNKIIFTDANTGWIVGDGDPSKTIDGGANWTADPKITSADFGNKSMKDIVFSGNGYGYIVGNGGKYAKTTDNGATWTVSDVPTGYNYFAMDFGATGTGWIVGDGGAIDKTINNATTWVSEKAPVTSSTLNATFFVDENTGFAVGENGTLIKTINGGENWTTISLGTTNTLYDVYFPSDNVGYICGDAVFYYTDDGGATWTSRSVTKQYYATKFINENIGWAVGGNNGIIIKTINRGATWTSTTALSPMWDLEILDASNVIAVGFSGVIEKTSDGGKNWSVIPSGTTDGLVSVVFVNNTVGFIATDGFDSGTPKLLKTTDGGNTWVTYATLGRVMKSMDFVTDTEGWAVSGNQSWHTTDGGKTWTAEQAHSNNELLSIHFPTRSTAYRVGYYGIIDKGTTPTSGLPPAYADNINPLDADIDIPVSKNLLSMVWEDGGSGVPTGYKLYFGTDGNGTSTPTNIVNGTNLGLVTSYSPASDLQYNTTYYWQIVPTNSNGDASYCPIWSFTTRADINFGGGGLSAPGYFFANSLPGASGAPSQPAYGWIDPVAAGHTEITSWTSGNSDDGYFSANIGFSFPFFGISYSSLFIGTNGVLTFGSGYSGKGSSATIPDVASPNNMIAVLLMDLTLADGGGGGGANGKVYYGTSGSNFVISWVHVYAAGTSDYMTFQVSISSNGDIQMQYNDTESISVPAPNSVNSDALIGIEDAFGSAGITYRNNGTGGNIFGSPNAIKFGGTNSALPVELTSFSADLTENGINLNWQTATEINNYGFDIERAVNNEWQKIGFVQGHGNSNSPKFYSYFDSDAPGGELKYRLKQLDIDGKYEYSNIIEVNNNALYKYSLKQNFPNPFNPATKISFSIAKKGNVNLSVYNALGQKISTLVNEVKNSGNYTVSFDASNLPSGIYFYKLESGKFTKVQKMLLLK